MGEFIRKRKDNFIAPQEVLSLNVSLYFKYAEDWIIYQKHSTIIYIFWLKILAKCCMD